MRPTIKFMLRAGAATLFASAISPLAFGQGSPRTESERIEMAVRERREHEALENEMRERAFDLRMAGEVHRPPRRREPKLAVAQIKEDFVRIQLINNALAEMVSRSGALDLKLVEKSTSEIKKRAERLKDNLALPELERVFERYQVEVGAEAGQLKLSLSTLDKLILEFVHNPIFKEAHVVNVQLSAKARRDLEDIIEMSDEVRKSSAKLNKALHKNQ